MTEDQKQSLIGLCKIEIRRWEAATEGVPDKKYMVDLMQIALAALIAPPVKVDDSMALAFHKALNDGGVGHEDLEEIKVGLEAALCNIPCPAPAADLADLAELVPDDRTFEDYCTQNPEMTMGDGMIRAAEWNSFRAAILRNIEEQTKC